MAGARFVIAGVLVLLWARFREGPRPNRVEWRVGLISGALLLLGGNGAVIWAEQRVPSGIAALLVAVVPLWMVLLEWLRPGGRRPSAAGVRRRGPRPRGLALLMGPESLRGGSSTRSARIVLVLGRCRGRRVALHQVRAEAVSGTMATGRRCSPAACRCSSQHRRGRAGTLDLAHASTESLVAFVYLVTFGSLIGFTAYVYLLAHTTAAKASTYAYVNPVVAVLLGWAIGNETVTKRTGRRRGDPRRRGDHHGRARRRLRSPAPTRSPSLAHHALRRRRLGDLLERPDAVAAHETQPGARQQRVVVQVVRAAHVPLEPRMEILAGDLARRELDVALRVAPALQVVRRVRRVPRAPLERIEDVVERRVFPTSRGETDRDRARAPRPWCSR